MKRVTVNFDLEPGDCKWSSRQVSAYGYAPASKLIEKYRAAMLDTYPTGKFIYFNFLEQDGSPWLGIDECLRAKISEVWVRGKGVRWEIINQARRCRQLEYERQLRDQGEELVPRDLKGLDFWKAVSEWETELDDRIRKVVVRFCQFEPGDEEDDEIPLAFLRVGSALEILKADAAVKIGFDQARKIDRAKEGDRIELLVEPELFPFTEEYRSDREYQWFVWDHVVVRIEAISGGSPLHLVGVVHEDRR